MKAISLFSGCGGDTLGMKMTGIDVVGYSELKHRFCETHDGNFPNSKLIGKDITKIPDEEFSKLEGTIDVIFAGFPCQTFSHGGKKKGTDDPRGQMYLQFSRAMRLVKPKYIIGENVAGLERRMSGDDKIIDIIVSEFKKSGYSCSYKVYRSDDFGVPQKRTRLFIVGQRGDVAPVLPEPPKVNPGNLTRIIQFTMLGALKVDAGLFSDIPPECILTDMSNNEDENNPHPYIIRQRERDLGFSFGKRASPYHCEIVDIRNPSKTIICTYDHQPRLLVPLMNAKGCFLRAMTPDELKQIQGFPSDYILRGSTKEQIIQVGNAVPPQMVHWICKAL